ncbi:MAG: SH3 domain-containing protein [Lachnospiraceae bacterium]|nr:SH3 domain-containing protein [Lachnospiraceae bacterium]
MLKRYILEIEIAVIVVLILLLCLRFQKKAERNEALLEGEHRVVEISEDGTIFGSGNRVYYPGGVQGLPTPTEEPGTPTPTPMSEEEARFAALSDADKEMYQKAKTPVIPDGIAFANVEESLSIREKASASSKQVGILYPNNYCIVESVDGDWAKITSGSVKGYCRSSYLVTGAEAVRYAQETMVCRAVTKSGVNVRSAPTTKENNKVKSVGKGTVFSVIEPVVFSDGDTEVPLFCKVQNGDQVAYVALSYVTVEYTWTAAKAVK